MNTQPFSTADLMDVLVQRAGLPGSARTDDPTATFADVGLDSLAFLQLQTALQLRYGFELLDDRAQQYTFGDIVALVNSNLTKEAA